jgi:hypothetical protein
MARQNKLECFLTKKYFLVNIWQFLAGKSRRPGVINLEQVLDLPEILSMHKRSSLFYRTGSEEEKSYKRLYSVSLDSSLFTM